MVRRFLGYEDVGVQGGFMGLASFTVVSSDQRFQIYRPEAMVAHRCP